jgi:mevalonate kinase
VRSANPARGPAAPLAVSTPGKIILMGEHAVVYGRPALISAIDLRLRARFAPRAEAAGGAPAVHLELPGLGCEAETSWAEVRAYARRARERWEGYAASPAPQSFRALRGGDPVHLVKVALGEAAEHLAREGGEEDGPGMTLRVDSDLPPGAGFGSSAAAAAAVVAGCLEFRGAPADLAAVERLVHEVERRQHGTPSGVDAATVLRGGLLWARRAGGAGAPLAIEPVALRSAALGRLAVHDTGAPAEATGEVVAAVRERRARDRAGTERLLDRMAAATVAFRAGLDGAAPGGDLRGPLAEFQECLEALGVVPAPVARIVRRIEAAGGAAKISGAGALSGSGAGALLVYHPDSGSDPGHRGLLDVLVALPARPVRFGAAGLRREALE